MRIRYFREFIELAKYLNFSVTSELLHMTQPGLSRHISMLEEEIGIKLFNRGTHSVMLTEEGEQFLEGIQKIVADYDLLCERVSKINSEKLFIGIPYFAINAYLTPVIADFENDYPKIKLNYLMSYPDEIVEGLLSRKVDLAIFPRVDFVNSDRLVFHDAFKEPLTLALNRNHPLALKKSLHICDLKNERFIYIEGVYGDALFGFKFDYCRKCGFEPKILMASDTIEAAALKMKPDGGVMLLPRHIRDANISRNIKFVDIRDEDCYFNVSLVHHRENENPAVQKFVELYLRCMKGDRL